MKTTNGNISQTNFYKVGQPLNTKKMKNVFFALAFMLVGTFAFANNSVNYEKKLNIENSYEMTNSSKFLTIKNKPESNRTYKVIVNISNNQNESFDCTIEGTVTITTEDGDSVSVEFKITANSCKEAMKVQSKIMEALE